MYKLNQIAFGKVKKKFEEVSTTENLVLARSYDLKELFPIKKLVKNLQEECIRLQDNLARFLQEISFRRSRNETE